MTRIDTEALLMDVDLPGLIQGRGVPLKKNGRDWRGKCPFHGGKNREAFVVVPAKGFAHCFVCGWGGDAIDFVMEYDHVGFREACTLIGSGLRGAPHITPEPPPPERITATPPAGPEPDMRSRWGTPSRTWCYRNAAGQPLGYVARYDYTDEVGVARKLTPQWTWGSRDGGQTWAWGCGHWNAPRPLYGLDLLAKHPDRQVLITEGEKACDAARSLLPGSVCITWPGGSGAVDRADWTPLAGRDVVIWPDADEAGTKACEAILAILTTAKRVRWLDVSDHADGWDAADAVAEGWDSARTLAWCRQQIRTEAPPEPAPEPIPLAPPEPEPEPPPPQRPVLTLSRGGAEPAPTPAETFFSWESLGLDVLKDGAAVINLDNACRVLTNHPATAGKLWYDSFHRQVRRQVDGKVRELTDTDKWDLAVWMQRDLRLRKMTDDLARKAIHLVASRDVRNEPLDWLSSLVWDGEPRLGTFLVDYFGASPSAYHTAVGTNFLRSMAARLLQPGCKVDTMPVFRGEQGTFKSQAMAALGDPWYAVPVEHVNSKDFFQALQGVWLMEIAEMETFSRAEIGAVKSLLSNPRDRYRKSYGENVQAYLRTVVFAGTTNQDTPLRDVTGARRFWPVECGTIAIEYLRRDRDQLFAEAAADVRAGKSWWIVPVAETKAVQESARQTDEWETLIWRHITQTNRDGVWFDRSEPLIALSIADAMREALNIPAGQWGIREQLRVADAFRAFGWKGARVNGQRLFRAP